MKTILFVKKVFGNPVSLILITANLAVDIWSHFFKPSVPGFRYDYYEEPTYFKIFLTVNFIPEFVAGFLFYPVDKLFSLEQNIPLQSLLFSLIFVTLSSLQWAFVGYFIVWFWRSTRKETPR